MDYYSYLGRLVVVLHPRFEEYSLTFIQLSCIDLDLL